MSTTLVTSYYTETTDGQVTGWFHRLADARDLVRKQGAGRIIKLRGPYFGEGFHIYYLELTESGRFKYA